MRHSLSAGLQRAEQLTDKAIGLPTSQTRTHTRTTLAKNKTYHPTLARTKDILAETLDTKTEGQNWSISQFHNHAQNVHALFWRATRSVNTADCKNEWKYFLKYNIDISIIIRFKQYLPSIIQPVEFTGRVARQNNGLYVLRMIVKLAQYNILYQARQQLFYL